MPESEPGPARHPHDRRRESRLGHRLTGTIAYLGAERAKGAALAVERFEYGAGEPSAAEDAVRMLEQECASLEVALREFQALAKSAPVGEPLS